MKTSDTAIPSGEKDLLSSRLNWLRAGVLGANDGIVSTAGVVAGVAGAAVSDTALLISGIAGLMAGALSMAAGEYVSVSTQRDSERAALITQHNFIYQHPLQAQDKLAQHFIQQGASPKTAQNIALELSQYDAQNAQAQYLLGIDPAELTNPWHAAFASMAAFALGAIIPLFAIILAPSTFAVAATFGAVTLALALTGAVSSYLGAAPIMPATIRNVLWGNIAMGVTYFIGALVGQNIL